MAHLIDKDALVAEIKRRIEQNTEWQDSCTALAFLAANEAIEEDKKILSIINTLEVKEVDLEKELESWRHNHFHGRRDKEASGEYIERVSQLDLAKHFFELGLKAQKGE